MAPVMRKVSLGFYLVVLGYVVLTPNQGGQHNGLLWFLNLNGSTEKFLNLLLLAPLPALLFWENPKIGFLFLFGIGPLISASIEISQKWIPGRVSDWHDFLLNTAGAILAAGLIFVKEN